MYKIRHRLVRFAASGRTQEYRGYITQYNYVQVNRRYDCGITDLILETVSGPRLFSASFPAGMKLYAYINSGGHLSRLDGILFIVEVLTDEQKVTAFKALDEQEILSGPFGAAEMLV